MIESPDSSPGEPAAASRLEVRLRRQTEWIMAAVGIGLPVCAMGLVLGVSTIGIGRFSGALNFITRGIAMVAISAILAFALVSQLGVRSRNIPSAWAEMIDLAIDRARGILTLVKAGLLSCLVAAVLGVAGTVIRTRLGRPPRMSPILDLVLLGLVVAALLLYAWHLRGELRKYRLLKQALLAGGLVHAHPEG